MTKQTHFLDLKIPLGCLIAFYGFVLVGYGFFTDPAIYQKSLNINVNVAWGIVMMFISVILLIVARFTKQEIPPNA